MAQRGRRVPRPGLTHIGLVLLTHQLGYFDILPLYVVLMVVGAAGRSSIASRRPLLLPLSLCLYLAALIVPITVPTWPVPGHWFFNPFAWQFLFVLGFALSRPDGIGRICAAPHKCDPDRCLPIMVLGAPCAVQPVPRPDHFSRAKLLFLNGKTFLTPMRLLQFLALAAVFSAAYPYIRTWRALACRIPVDTGAQFP